MINMTLFFQLILNFLGVEAYQQNGSMLAWPKIWPKSKWQKGPLLSFFLFNFILSVTKKKGPFLYPFSVKQGYICYKSNRWSCSCNHVSGHKTFFMQELLCHSYQFIYPCVHLFKQKFMFSEFTTWSLSLMSAGWGCIFQRLCSIT